MLRAFVIFKIQTNQIIYPFDVLDLLFIILSQVVPYANYYHKNVCKTWDFICITIHWVSSQIFYFDPKKAMWPEMVANLANDAIIYWVSIYITLKKIKEPHP